jgi:hypothetical protein
MAFMKRQSKAKLQEQGKMHITAHRTETVQLAEVRGIAIVLPIVLPASA